MLSDSTVKNAKVGKDGKGGPRARKLADGGGLYLYVSPAAAKSWRYDYRFNGRRRTVTFGLYPALSLAMARDRHYEARRLLASGIDPATKKRQDRLEALEGAKNTVRAIGEAWYAEQSRHKSESWRQNARRWLDQRIYPAIGSRGASDVTSADVLGLVKDMAKDYPKSAETVRQMLSRIFTYGVRNQRCAADPAHAVRGAVIVPPVVSYQPLRAGEVYGFLESMRAYQGRRSTVIAAELLLLTCVRKTEVIQSEVAEIDVDAALWRIPGARMKNGLDHIVPLSRQALELFREAVSLNCGSRYVFPNFSRRDKPMARSTLNVMWDRCALTTPPHALRGTFSTAANESGDFRSDVIEKTLAHIERNRVRRAYNAAEYLEERRELLQWWADFVNTKPGANVTALGKRRRRA